VNAVNDAPLIAEIGPQTIAEGDDLIIAVSANDPENDGLSFSLDSAPAGVTIDADTGVLSWTPADGPEDPTTITVRVADNGTPSKFSTESFDVTVTNVPPTIELEGNSVANEGEAYILTLGSITDPGDDTVTQYLVDWGDGEADTFNTAGPVFHVYSTPGDYTVSVALDDEDGSHENAGALDVRVRPDRLLSIPTLSGGKFDVITVPVQVDIGDEISGVVLEITYDSRDLVALAVAPGPELAGFAGTIDFGTPGTITVNITSAEGLPLGTGPVDLVEIVFFILPRAKGVVQVDLQAATLSTPSAELPELALEVQPQPGPDATDGAVEILGGGRGRGGGGPQSTVETSSEPEGASINQIEADSGEALFVSSDPVVSPASGTMGMGAETTDPAVLSPIATETPSVDNNWEMVVTVSTDVSLTAMDRWGSSASDDPLQGLFTSVDQRSALRSPLFAQPRLAAPVGVMTTLRALTGRYSI